MKKLSRRKKALLLFAAGNLLPVCYVLWMCYGSPRAITISKETTYLTEPLTADGRYVDYNQYLKQEIGEHNYRDDLWKALVSPDRPEDESTEWALSQVPDIRYRHPGEKLAASSEAGYPRVDRDRETARERVPFTKETDPEYAAIIEANEPWYQAVMETEPGPVGVDWPDPEDGRIGLPINDVHHQLVSAFQLRASLAFGSDDFATAMESIEFILKVASRERTVPFYVNQGAGSRMAERAFDNFCVGILQSDAVPESVLREWDERRFKLNWEQWLKTIELSRLDNLQYLQVAHKRGGTADLFYAYRFEFGEPAGNFCINRVDFDVAMREVNRSFDEAKPAFRIDNFQESVSELRKIDTRVNKRWPSARTNQAEPKFLELITEDHTAWAVQETARLSYMAKYQRAQIADNQNAWRRIRICIRLQVYRKKYDRWPKALDELLTLEGWEIDEAELLTDSYSQQPIRYGLIDDGFVIYSVGPDGKDNTNGNFPPSDDKISWEYPPGDDRLWPWPDPRYQWEPKDQEPPE